MNNLMTQKELCDWLKISKTTAERWRKEGMPYCKLSERSLRFNVDDVNKWISGKK